MGNSSSQTIDKAMLAIEMSNKVAANGNGNGCKRTPCVGKRSRHKTGIDEGSDNGKQSGSCLEDKKTSSPNRRVRLRGIAKHIDDCEVDDIYHLVKKLKKGSQGQKLLNEFVDFQTGKSTKIPLLLELACEEPSHSSNDEEDFPFAGMEIQITS